MTVKELGETYMTIPWKEYINNAILQDFEVSDDHRIWVQSPSLFKKFEKLMANTTNDNVEHYVRRKIQNELDSYKLENMRESNSTHIFPRFKQECAKKTSSILPVIAAAFYVREHFSEEEKDQVVEIEDDIAEKFKTYLKKVTPKYNCHSQIQSITTSEKFRKLVNDFVIRFVIYVTLLFLG